LFKPLSTNLYQTDLLANLAYTAVLNVTSVTGNGSGSNPNEIIGIYFVAQIAQKNVPLTEIKEARALSFFIALSAFGASAVLMQR